MSAITATLAINSFSSGLIEKVTVSKKTTVKTLKDYSSGFGQAATFDPITEFEVSGRGDDAALSLGVATSGLPSSISGGVTIITASGQSQTAEDFQSWHFKGTNYPGAS